MTVIYSAPERETQVFLTACVSRRETSSNAAPWALFAGAEQAPAAEQAVPTRWTLTVSPEDVNAMADGVPHHDTIGTWHVQPGDNFWHMAGQILTDAYGRSPTPAEHRAYWAQLVDANRDRLVRSGDPSTIYAGQDFAVILPALTDGHSPLFGAAPHAAQAGPP